MKHTFDRFYSEIIRLC